MSVAVALDEVVFTYPDAAEPVLDRVSFELEESTFALVTGATGAGKSTLLRVMNGLVPHFTGGSFSGRAMVQGRDTLQHAPRRLSDVVAFVPQDPAASFVLDRVEDELAYAMENLAVGSSSMRKRVEEALDLLDIERLRDRSVRSLSGGEKQRVAIAAALTPGPRVLLLDEPTSQLDPQGAEDVLAALQRLVHDMGLTVVIAEHRLERVAGFVDLAIGCRAGSIRVGEPSDVLAELGTGPPVTRLGRLVGWSPPPLTVREARRRATGVALGPPAPPPGDDRSDVVLRARSLSAGYGSRSVIEGLDAHFSAGEIVALIGRNGAGKTTLLRCLAGVHHPTSGTVDVEGHPPRPGRDVALCPQNPDALLFADSVTEEVDATPRWAPGAPTTGEVLASLGLDGLAAEHPRDSSAGERLLIAVAAIAATGAPVLLLDEPTRGLDLAAKDRLGVFLRERASDGKAIVFATHDVELAAEVASRVLMLAGGEIVADGDPAEVLSDSSVFSPQMTRVFGPGWLTPRQVAGAMT